MVVGLAVLMAGLLTVQAVIVVSGKSNHAVVLGIVAVGYVLGGGLAFVIVRRLVVGFGRVAARLDACGAATEGNLKPALEALAAGDLTVDLRSGTAAESNFAGDELGGG